MLHRGDKREAIFIIFLAILFSISLYGWDFIGPTAESIDWVIFEEMNLRDQKMPLGPFIYPIPPVYVSNFVALEQGFFSEKTKYLFGGKKREWGVDIYPQGRLEYRCSPRPALLVGTGVEFERWGIYSSYKVDRKLAKDKEYRGKVWHGIAGEACELGISFAPAKNWYLRLGRTGLSIGSGLIFSRYKRPIDTAELLWLSPSFRLLAFTSFLDKYHKDDSTIYRYLSSHRFEYANRFFSAAFTEFSLYGGPNRLPEWYYIIPLYFYHGEQLNREYDDNTILFFELRMRYIPFYFGFEFLLDDVQIEHTKPEEKAPMFYGLNMEMRFLSHIKEHLLTLIASYKRVSNWTFNQRKEWNRFVYEGRPLGDSLGNDYDRTTLCARYFWKANLWNELVLELARKGEGRIFTEWSMPWVDVEGEYREKFPLGTVEENYIAFFNTNYFEKRLLRLNAKAGYMWRKNISNIRGNNDSGPVLALNILVIGEFDGFLKKLLTK